jgi:molybdopterin converting factor small subunit
MMMGREEIKVHVKLAGFIDRKMVTAEFDLEVPAGTTVKGLFARADKSGQVPGKVMSKLLRMPRPPTVLLNGRSLDLPEELSRELVAGDDVAVMTPMAGG